MADYRDTFTSEIYVNQSQAQDAVEKYTKKLEDLNKQLASIDKSQDGWEKKEKKLQRQIQSTERTLKTVQTGVQNYQKAMNNLDGRSIASLIKLKKQLNAEIKKLVPGTQEYIRLTQDFKKVEARIKSLTTATQSMSTRITGFFTKYWTMFDTLSKTITGLSMKFRQSAEDAAKLDDVYADVMKTTGLLHDEVQELDKALMKIDTRTSREQLLLLARDAGKLGIQGKENILGFVRAADQIQVALGEDLGEGAIRNLGKIADVLGYTQSMGIEKSLLSIASSINAVGQASTASEAYLVDFTQRLAGVAAQTGISAANIIGFASGLDQSAMKVEMASTAFQKFIMKLYEDPAKFAAYANLEVGKFTDLLKNDANQAIITILQALKDKDGFASLVPVFKDMGLDGARAVSVLAAMATNINAVTEAQALANVEFEKATSVTEEYNTKNNNLQAQLEKARKEFKNASIALGQSLNPVLLKSTKGVTYLIKALANYGKEIKATVISIAALTAVIKASTIAHTAYNAIIKAGQAIKATYIVVTKALEYAFALLRGQVIAATKAYIAMNAAMNASVFGIIATAIAGLTAIITHYVKKQREAAEAADWLAQTEKKANEEYAEQAGKVKTLTKIVEDNNIALSERKKALEELRSIVPEYHAELTEEGRLINANREAIDDYCKALRKQIRLQAYQDQLMELETQIAKVEEDMERLEQEKMDALVAANGDDTEKVTVTFKDKMDYGVEKSFERLTDYGLAVERIKNKQENELNPLLEKEAAINAKIGDVSKNNASRMQKDIDAVRIKYKQLFNEVNEQYRDNPQKLKEEKDRLEQEQKTEVAKIREKYAEKKEVEKNLQADINTTLSESQFDYLQDHYEKLTKKEQKMVDAGYAALSDTDSKALKARYNKLMQADKKYDDQRYQEQVKRLEQAQRKADNDALRMYSEGAYTFKEYEERKREIQAEYTQKRIDLAKKEGKDYTSLEQQQLNASIEERKRKYNELLKEEEAGQKNEENALKKQLLSNEITQEQYDSRMLEIRVKYLQKRLELAKENGQDETAILKAILDAQLEAEMLAFEQMEKLKKEAKDLVSTPGQKRDEEKKKALERLEQLHKAMLIADEEYAKASKAIEKKYADEALQEKVAIAQKYASQVNSIMQEASNFVTALKEAESAKLEAQYQKDLTAAGDNAEKREQIEADYEQKKLDLQKKYADVDMAINIAKAIAAGALAAVQAFAAAGNPILGAVFAGLVAAATAAEVATIVQQRNAIKNSSVNSSASSASSNNVNTGQRTITGHADGGYTEDHTTLATVGEEGVEWIAPHWMVRDNPTTFANLERYRKSGIRGRKSLSDRGFADGGFSDGSIPGSAVTKEDIEAAVESVIIRTLGNNYIRAYVVRRDITELDDQDNRFKKQTSRG